MRPYAKYTALTLAWLASVIALAVFQPAGHQLMALGISLLTLVPASKL